MGLDKTNGQTDYQTDEQTENCMVILYGKLIYVIELKTLQNSLPNAF